MKKKVLTILFCGLVLIAKSQNTSEKSQKQSVEKSIFGIQTGFAGLWINNELKLSNQIVALPFLGHL
tara:strand:+ start:769 stop:969 length:201 start_codon:yes stop_codon:yes gene_type:complete